MDAIDKIAIDLMDGVGCAGGCASPSDVADAIRAAVEAERAACLAAVEATIADHDEDTPGGWCAANAARHAANAIRNRKE